MAIAAAFCANAKPSLRLAVHKAALYFGNPRIAIGERAQLEQKSRCCRCMLWKGSGCQATPSPQRSASGIWRMRPISRLECFVHAFAMPSQNAHPRATPAYCGSLLHNGENLPCRRFQNAFPLAECRATASGLMLLPRRQASPCSCQLPAPGWIAIGGAALARILR